MNCGLVKVRVRHDIFIVVVQDNALVRLNIMNGSQCKVLPRIIVQTYVCVCVCEAFLSQTYLVL